MDASLKAALYDLTELDVVNKLQRNGLKECSRGSLGNSETWMGSRNTTSSSTMKPLRTAVTVQGFDYLNIVLLSRISTVP